MRNYFDEIKEELENLKKENNALLVEGKKDKKALTNIGFRGNRIFMVNMTGKSLYAVIDDFIGRIGNRKACILTDLDKKGRILYCRIKERLAESGIKIDSRLRHLLIKEGLSHVEGLDTYLEHGLNNDKKKGRQI